MATETARKRAARCVYQRVCYLAEDLKCYGFKADCVLYMKSNGQEFDQRQFDDAMNELINTTRARFDRRHKS